MLEGTADEEAEVVEGEELLVLPVDLIFSSCGIIHLC